METVCWIMLICHLKMQKRINNLNVFVFFLLIFSVLFFVHLLYHLIITSAVLLFVTCIPGGPVCFLAARATVLSQYWGLNMLFLGCLHSQQPNSFFYFFIYSSPKMKILSLMTYSVTNYSCHSKAEKPSFIFETQIIIFLMESESSLTLHRQQGYYHVQCTET